MGRAVAILSGGMDSALSAWIAKSEYEGVIALHFNYGQRTQRRELEAFEAICHKLKPIERYIIDLPFFSQIGASALIDTRLDVPTGGLEDGIPVTYVPFRNGIFLSIATAIAEKEKAEAIYIGVVEEDSSGYPDCRHNFISAFSKAANLGTKEETEIAIKMPLVHMQKDEIVSKAIEIGVPLELTWSCYQNELQACGLCDSCRLRLRGFEKAGFKDPIPYLSHPR